MCTWSPVLSLICVPSTRYRRALHVCARCADRAHRSRSSRILYIYKVTRCPTFEQYINPHNVLLHRNSRIAINFSYRVYFGAKSILTWNEVKYNSKKMSKASWNGVSQRSMKTIVIKFNNLSFCIYNVALKSVYHRNAFLLKQKKIIIDHKIVIIYTQIWSPSWARTLCG